MLDEKKGEQPMWRNHSDKPAVLIDDGQRRFAVTNRAPCGTLLVHAGRDRRFTVHQG